MTYSIPGENRSRRGSTPPERGGAICSGGEDASFAKRAPVVDERKMCARRTITRFDFVSALASFKTISLVAAANAPTQRTRALRRITHGSRLHPVLGSKAIFSSQMGHSSLRSYHS